MPRQDGYVEQPQNRLPAFAPFFVLRRIILLPHLGQGGASRLVGEGVAGIVVMRVTGATGAVAGACNGKGAVLLILAAGRATASAGTFEGLR